MNAVCHRCGERKSEAAAVCPDCGYRPEGEDRALAWLFSRAHLSEAELVQAASRVREGERAEPGSLALATAARALGQAPPDEADRVAAPMLMLLGLGCVLFTPILGLAIWYGLKPTRPRSAWAAMRTTLPATVAFCAFWVGVLFG